jgi:hypothetical protein
MISPIPSIQTLKRVQVLNQIIPIKNGSRVVTTSISHQPHTYPLANMNVMDYHTNTIVALDRMITALFHSILCFPLHDLTPSKQMQLETSIGLIQMLVSMIEIPFIDKQKRIPSEHGMDDSYDLNYSYDREELADIHSRIITQLCMIVSFLYDI